MFAPLALLPGVLVSGVLLPGVLVSGVLVSAPSAAAVPSPVPARAHPVAAAGAGPAGVRPYGRRVTARADAGVPTPDAVWDALADCESGGDWQADTGNGYYGGLQIWPPTWAEAGGLQFAARPDLAARREQITVAEEILSRQGWQAWASCARQIGLLPRTGPGRGAAHPQASSPFATFVPSSTATGRPASG
ncbi:transglycosylase family protein [Kitasatospora sp. NE20-6]|uniref:transglycosylase family protein n=1 Tax=Kitasatospora sp. NE20-6 TaxID=2859066 RepID=UPI0038B3EA9A